MIRFLRIWAAFFGIQRLHRRIRQAIEQTTARRIVTAGTAYGIGEERDSNQIDQSNADAADTLHYKLNAILLRYF
jgi:hypothetical protein